MRDVTHHLQKILLVAVVLESARSCPSMCVCKWKNGKQTVECGGKALLAIPEGMDHGTQVLEFSDNKLEALLARKFLNLDLINLQRIYLARNKIRTVDEETFRGLTNLVELDLTGNLLDSVPTPTFAHCPALMRLTLSYNPIRVLKRGAFEHLPFLSTLEMSNCIVFHVDEGAFQGLHSLEWLHLDGNRLRTLRGIRVLPESLRGIELQANAWECDCNLRDLQTWLLNFSVSLSIEPLCSGPDGVSGRAIKSLHSWELACLPDVSPTTFYLEVEEGQNVSLVCQIHAVPGANVSWRFQGQILKNDTAILPGVKLLYYLDDEMYEKRSELFLYDVESETNGTFTCRAENYAGIVQSNFTVRVILKEEPTVMVIKFPFEYFLAVIVGVSVFSLTLVTTFVVLIVRCRRRKRKSYQKEQNKEITLQYQRNPEKCLVSQEVDRSDTNTQQEQRILYYGTISNENLLQSISSETLSERMRSPTSLSRLQLDRNPDVISEAENIGRRRDGDGEDVLLKEDCPAQNLNLHGVHGQFPIACVRTNRKLYNIHSWDPGCSLDADGYPVDYGLPRPSGMQVPHQTPENFYRTLPYNRSGRRQSAATPAGRYSREAEFLSRSAQPPPYEHYCGDVRYTLDGYPAKSPPPHETKTQPQPALSPPEPYRGGDVAPVSLPCCSSSSLKWSGHVPANVHLVRSLSGELGNVTRRCASAQTEEDEPHPVSCKTNISFARDDRQGDALTESPDEGYEGEPTVI